MPTSLRSAFGALLGASSLMAFTPAAAHGPASAAHLRTPRIVHAALRDTVDLLIAGGTVVDGTGSPERVADVGVRGDRIVFVGDAAAAHVVAARRIDARGLFVAPGFIDPHTHTGGDLSSPERHGNVPYLMQGVTTVVVGNDGGGPVEIAQTFDRWERQGIGTNAALYVGFGTVRERVLGMSSAAPTPAQLDSMRALVDRAMREGALGLSTGLFYPPQSFAATEEVIVLAKVAARYGGIYDSHLRDESSYNVGLVGAVAEALRIGRAAHLPVHIAHIKALGVDVWGKSDTVIAMIQEARRAGLEVTADQYPYTASGTSFSASLLPRWAVEGGHDSLAARIADPVQHARLVADMRENLRRRGGAASLLVTKAHDSTLVGKTLADIATARHLEPVEAALAVIAAGGASVASFNMNEQDIDRFMRARFVMTGSDGSEGMPRKYGTYPRKLREYVFTKHVLTLPEMVHKSSALVAAALHLRGRGTLAPRYYADVVVFDSTITDRATYESPEVLSTGVRYVLVNGKLAVDAGRVTGVLAGRGLRRGGAGDAERAAGR
ncbi:MAG: amidohydrolase family protein [Gemmatimonadaceae bacterium]|nr:amidohydrolase family protein [Gemmatimonadaceae bacterium]